MSIAQRWGYFFSYWVIGLFAVLVLLVPLLGRGDLTIRSLAILTLVGIIWISKFVRVLFSLNRCPFVDSPLTVHEAHPVLLKVFWLIASVVPASVTAILLSKEATFRDIAMITGIGSVITLVVIYRRHGTSLQ